MVSRVVATNERIVMFVEGRSLVGVMTRLGENNDAGDQPAVLMLNTGFIHRVGHHRMNVVLARALARNGHTVLRFDFSGTGDSDNEGNEGSTLQSVLTEIRQAMDWLECTHNESRVII